MSNVQKGAARLRAASPYLYPKIDAWSSSSQTLDRLTVFHKFTFAKSPLATFRSQLSKTDVNSDFIQIGAECGLMAQGVPGIIGACLEHSTALDLSDRVYSLHGQVDQLRRVWHHGENVYAPYSQKIHTIQN